MKILQLLETVVKKANNSKNYERAGGNKEHHKWKITLTNGKFKTVTAESAKQARTRLSTNQLIIGVRSIKKVS